MNKTILWGGFWYHFSYAYNPKWSGLNFTLPFLVIYPA